ncbi:hypothetical protein E4U55_004663 [Claviceps digitariae]|nr:hypothetical protein E4U55_004663 [Claviceps digitariae]
MPMPFQSPRPGLSAPSCAPSILPPLPPLPPDCSPAARSSSPRHHLWPQPLPHSSSSTPRRRASRPQNPAAGTPSPTTPVRRRRQNTACSHAATTTTTTTITTINPPVLWGVDTIADHPPSAGNITSQLGLGAFDDDFLSAFADHEFSSPSSYPQFTAGLSADGESQPTVSSSSHENWDEPRSQLSDGSFPELMPPPPGLHHLHSEISTSPVDKQRQPPLALDASLSSVMMEPSQGPLVPDDDLFGDSITPQGVYPVHNEDLTTIDLTEATDVPEHLKKPLISPKEDNRVKISKFQCVICMDDASTLTVTHCGHLYCAQCLHSSLHVEATKNKCPMCRAKIDVKSRATYSTKTKGFWPLELKLMTATRKGKRKADTIS